MSNIENKQKIHDNLKASKKEEIIKMAAQIVEIGKIDKLKADSLQRSWPSKKKEK